MDLALKNQQRLICHKTQPTNQPTNLCFVGFAAPKNGLPPTKCEIIRFGLVMLYSSSDLADYLMLNHIYLSIYLLQNA